MNLSPPLAAAIASSSPALSTDLMFAFRVIEVVDKIRANAERPRNPEIDLSLIRETLEHIEHLGSNEDRFIHRVIESLQSYLQDPNSRLAAVDIKLEDNHRFLLGFVRPSKGSKPFFEAIVYSIEPTDAISDSTLQGSKAESGIVLACSAGLDNEEVLGIFPEHWAVCDESQQEWPDAFALYLVDRFAKRFLKHSLCVLQVVTQESSFANLKEFVNKYVGDDFAIWGMLYSFAGKWLRRHEVLHFTGALPLSSRGKRSRLKANAGFEELRVDLLSILQLKKEETSEKFLNMCVAEYILLERLCTYAMVDLQDNKTDLGFDTIGGQYLLLRLVEAGGLIIEDGNLRLLLGWPSKVEEIVDQMEDWQSKVKDLDESTIDSLLERHVTQVCRRFCPSLKRRDFGTTKPFPFLDLYFDIAERVRDKTQLKENWLAERLKA